MLFASGLIGFNEPVINLPHLTKKQIAELEKPFSITDWLWSIIYSLDKDTVFYTSVMAAIITNGLISQHFTLHRDIGQGCPLSPSLFAIFIEPRTAAICQNTNITGIHTENMVHRINLYADDVLLYLHNPSKSLPETINLINAFFKISDYSISDLISIPRKILSKMHKLI